MTLDKDDLQEIKAMFELLMKPVHTRLDSLETHAATSDDTQQAILDTLSAQAEKNHAFQDTQQAMLHSLTVIENVQYPRIAAALDGYSVNRDKLDEHDGRISFLERKADIHDTRLFGLEQEKQKA
jgi:hypothetical protein